MAIVAVVGVLIFSGVVYPRLAATAAAAPRRAAAAAQTEAIGYKNQNAVLREEVARLEAVVAQLRVPQRPVCGMTHMETADVKKRP